MAEIISVQLDLCALDGHGDGPIAQYIKASTEMTLRLLKTTKIIPFINALDAFKDNQVTDVDFVDRGIHTDTMTIGEIQRQREPLFDIVHRRRPFIQLRVVIVRKENVELGPDVSPSTIKHNPYFRRITYTAPERQEAIMSLLPGEIIPRERHIGIEQIFHIHAGEALFTVEGMGDAISITAGNSFTVPEGYYHKVVNVGETLLQLFTIYAIGSGASAPHEKGEINIRQESSD